MKRRDFLKASAVTAAGVASYSRKTTPDVQVRIDGNLLISNDLFEGVTLNDGKLVLPDRPGLGLKTI